MSHLTTERVRGGSWISTDGGLGDRGYYLGLVLTNLKVNDNNIREIIVLITLLGLFGLLSFPKIHNKQKN